MTESCDRIALVAASACLVPALRTHYSIVSIHTTCSMAVNVNVNSLLAISESDFDNSGEPGPQAGPQWLCTFLPYSNGHADGFPVSVIGLVARPLPWHSVVAQLGCDCHVRLRVPSVTQRSLNGHSKRLNEDDIARALASFVHCCEGEETVGKTVILSDQIRMRSAAHHHAHLAHGHHCTCNNNKYLLLLFRVPHMPLDC